MRQPMRGAKRCFSFCIGFVVLALLAQATRAQQQAKAEQEGKYYMVIFGSVGGTAAPRTSHVFATFVKADGLDKNSKLEIHTISWLPETLNVAPVVPPERGKNLDLPATMAWAKSLKSQIVALGPYEIKKELYDR